MHIRFLSSLMLVGALLGPAWAAPPTTGLRVLETFEVGANVYVRSLKFDRAANSMWVGTSVGVHEIDLKNVKPKQTFTRKDGLANEYVFAVGIDSQGGKWFGTNAGGASRWNNGKWQTFFPMHGLADYWIYAFANDKKGDLWIGTWAGANHYNVKTGEFKTYVKELINEWVYGITVDAQGRTWFGTEGGVSMYDGRKWRAWTHKDGLGAPNADSLEASTNTGLGTRSRHDLSVEAAGKATYNPNYVFSILSAPDGSIWAGTWGGGVGRFDGRKWKNYNTTNGLAGNIVYSMVMDTNGVFWFGTNRGVSRFDGKTWKNIGPHEGLMDSNVYALEVAPNGNIWAGTKRGVARIGE